MGEPPAGDPESTKTSARQRRPPSDMATEPGLADTVASPGAGTPNSRDTERRVLAARIKGQLFDSGTPPVQVGRYRILERIGSGGMGSVYVAEDPELDRKVALKLLHAERSDADRLLREARALARLSHPNVVTVHEIGAEGEEVFVAMEFVDGVTLRKWASSQSRTWREVLEVSAQAARGLAAAHRAGIVHRDFKPDNVMVGEGEDGESVRARVVDFGLATDGIETPGETDDEPRISGPLLTATGALLGTPAYMAPEQHRREVVDARADQFAFCVTVWELLFGARPFRGATLASLTASVLGDEVPEPERRGVPGSVVAALRRGLSRDADARFANMDALLEAMRPPRRRWPWAVGVSAGLAAAAAVVATQSPDPASPDTESVSASAQALGREALAITVTATAQERQAKAQAFLDAHGDTAPPGLLAIAEAALGRAQLRRSCRAPKYGLCVAYQPPVEAESRCRGGLLGVTSPAPRDEATGEAQAHLRAAWGTDDAGLEPASPEHDAFTASRAAAGLALADLKLEALLADHDDAGYAVAAAAGGDALQTLLAARVEAAEGVAAAYDEAGAISESWRVVADARVGVGWTALVDELIAVPMPPAHASWSRPYCDGLGDLWEPLQARAVRRLRSCRDAALAQGRSDEYVDVCETLARRIDAFDQESIKLRVRKNLRIVRTCYNTALEHDPEIEGKIILSWTVAPDGAVQDIAVVETIVGHEEIGRCIARGLEKIEFPKPSDGRPAEVTFPFELEPG